jgi:hypothetical protein
VEAERFGDDGRRDAAHRDQGEERDHHGTVEREGLLRQLQQLRRAVPDKARLVLANSWRKARTRSGCCGNYGQPGC